jgi:hypothetical protein
MYDLATISKQFVGWKFLSVKKYPRSTVRGSKVILRFIFVESQFVIVIQKEDMIGH